jgi:polysaccharide pyruvyl transferase WcaK-like protein
VQVEKTTMCTARALVLGYYDRANTGDEMYKRAIPAVFGSRLSYRFLCTDDATRFDTSPFDLIIVGGGDVINGYFMSKVDALIADFGGSVYAYSVGVGYPDDAKYLDRFDHVFVRSREDYDVAVRRVGTRNVTFSPDACFVLRPFKGGHKKDRCRTRIGVCLAQPVLSVNPGLLGRIAEALNCLSDAVTITAIPFNLSAVDASESDVVASGELVKLLSKHPATVPRCANADDVIAALGNVDVVLAMRYHSAVFGVAAPGWSSVTPPSCYAKCNNSNAPRSSGPSLSAT